MRGHEWLWLAGAVGVTGLLFLVLADRYPEAVQTEGTRQSLLYYLAWLALMVGSVIMHIRRRPLAALKHIAVWAGLILLLVAGYSYRDLLTGVYADARARITGELVPQRGVAVGADAVRFRLAGDGHFHVEAEVNGARVDFMLDTGASDVVLTPEDARRLGWDPEALDYTRPYDTANGTVRGAPVRLDEVRIGPIRLRDVAASVNQTPMESSLLGMSLLKRLSGVEFQGDQLTLRQ
jgi:aspartyl protease family protein